MRANGRPGDCVACGRRVAAEKGFLFKAAAGNWAVCCRSAQCCKAADLDPAAEARRVLTADGRVLTPYDPAALPLLRALPGAKWDRDAKTWTVSLDPSDRPRLLELADRLGLDVAPELQEVPTIPEVEEGVARAEAGGAYPYQLDGVRWLAAHESALLGDDMGLGKTAQVLWALPAGASLIVVCPKSLKINWANEVRRWRPDLTTAILEGRGSFRWPSKPGEVVILNYEILPAELPARPEGFGVVVAPDEVHRAKSHKAQRTQRLRALVAAADRVWGMTGTPLLNRPLDLWGVLNACESAKAVFGGWMGFARSFGGYKGRFGWEFGQPDDSVAERLRRVMIRRTKAEVLPDLPRKRYERIVVELDSATSKACDRWMRDHDWSDTDDELPAFSEFSALRAKLAKSRISAAVEIVEDCEEQDVPLLVFSAHREPVEKIGARDGWAAILGGTPAEERQRIVDAFQAGKLKGVALTIAAGGVGLTLTHASTVLFVDLDWTPGNNAQAEDRAARIGQTAEFIRVIRMVSDHVLDRHVQGLLEEKQALISKAIEHVASYAIPATDTLDVINETEEEWQARVDAMQAAAAEADLSEARAEATGKIGKKVRQLVTRGRKLPESFDDEHADAVRAAVRFLAARCDGAVTQDEVGFNKADTYVGRWLALAGMDDLRALQLGWAIVQKYVGQAGDHAPLAFGAPSTMGGA